jgi:hypothetical protein
MMKGVRRGERHNSFRNQKTTFYCYPTRAFELAELFASKNRRDTLLLTNPPGCVNSRQERKLTHGL